MDAMNLDSINHGHIKDLEEPESKSCSFSSFLFAFWLYLIHIIIFVWYVLASTSLHFSENVHPLICLLLLFLYTPLPENGKGNDTIWMCVPPPPLTLSTLKMRHSQKSPITLGSTLETKFDIFIYMLHDDVFKSLRMGDR